MKKLGILLIFLGVLGCDKKEASPYLARLVGKWQLSEFCVSPGDGSCPRQMATAVFSQTLEFFEDGTFTEKTPLRAQFQTPVVSSGTYRVNSSEYLYLKFDDTSSFQEEVQWNYAVVTDGNSQDKYLVIRPNVCREGCEYRYDKID